MLRKGPTSLLEVGPFVYSLRTPWGSFFIPLADVLLLGLVIFRNDHKGK